MIDLTDMMSNLKKFSVIDHSYNFEKVHVWRWGPEFKPNSSERSRLSCLPKLLTKKVEQNYFSKKDVWDVGKIKKVLASCNHIPEHSEFTVSRSSCPLLTLLFWSAPLRMSTLQSILCNRAFNSFALWALNKFVVWRETWNAWSLAL